jgi:hypothetical protein
MQEERTMDRNEVTDARPVAEERERMLMDYAAGKISWRELRRRGFTDYAEVLGGLGEIGLRPPIAKMEGPSRSARERGRSLLRRLLRETARS